MSEKNQAPAIAINVQYIKDLSLEIPLAPQIFKEITESPKINIEVEVNAEKIENNVSNVVLKFHLNGDIKGKKLFILELEYAAVVSLNVAEEHVEPILMVEVPRMLFPFARSIITNCMVDGGLPPFMIAPIDFLSLYTSRKAKQ